MTAGHATTTNRPAEAGMGILREYWSVLMRHKLAMIVVFAITAGLVTTAALLLPPTYTARSTLLVKFGREFIYLPEVGSPTGSRTFSLAEMVNSEVEILTSRDVAQQVVSEIGPLKLYPALGEQEFDERTILARATGIFRESLSVMAVLESSVIKVSFEHPSRQFAADALNLLVDKFKDKHLEIFSEEKSGFLAVQLEGYRNRLQAAEAALESFKQERSVYDLQEQKNLLLGQRVELDGQHKTTEFAISELEQKLSLLDARETPEAPQSAPDLGALLTHRADLGKILEETEFREAEVRQLLARLEQRRRDPGAAPAAAGPDLSRSLEEGLIRLLDLQLREEQLLQGFDENSRQVASLRREMQVVNDFLRSRGSYLQESREASLRDEMVTLAARKAAVLEQLDRLDAELRSVELQETLAALAPLQARRDRIAREIRALDEEIRALDRNHNQLRRLEREVIAHENNLQAYLDKTEEARISEELDRQKMINIRVVEHASPPLEPSGLGKKLRIALGLVAGLVAAVAVSVFLELARP